MTETQGEAALTCGRGLAANAALPRLLSELMGAQADVLERHTRAIDTTDGNAAGGTRGV
ncbi:MAG: hypothetical protein JOY61_04605 [Chloroflexi bacterium]|nr:hypothetical protein [Chloroflexota bacterium]